MAVKTSPYDSGLDRTPANYVPLSPLSFLPRTASVFPDRNRRHPWRSAPDLAADP